MKEIFLCWQILLYNETIHRTTTNNHVYDTKVLQATRLIFGRRFELEIRMNVVIKYVIWYQMLLGHWLSPLLNL